MRHRWWVLAAVLAAAIPLGWLLVRMLEKPLSEVVWFALWYADLLLGTIPQVAYWTLFLCLAAAIAVAGLWVRRRPEPEANEGVTPQRGAVRRLAHSIRRADEGHYFRWILARQLGQRIIEAMDISGQMAAGVRRQWWVAHGQDLPPAIRAYIEAALWGGFWHSRGVGSRLRRALSTDQAVTPLDLDLETVVRFLESKVEGVDEQQRS